ncbi:hypothetical protein C8R44DRAFT_893799 [Mycena epipterygia]|nr:hypothetical protein C8R44DRAFT_893799 [Mycena epipterygia]
MSAAIRARINAAIAAILASNPAHWRRGVLYDFGIPVTQPPPLTTNRRARRAAARRPEIKIGRSNRPLRRQREWKQKCWPQQQDWWFYWDVPDAPSFERLIHLHFKLHGAWIRPEECEFCGTKHCEKFDYARCGGSNGVVAVVEYYLRHLGWPINSACPKLRRCHFPRAPPPRRRRPNFVKKGFSYSSETP